MSGLDALHAVRYVTVKGKRLAVVEMDEWEAMIAWLEQVEDTQIAKAAYSDLERAGGNRERAGWLR